MTLAETFFIAATITLSVLLILAWNNHKYWYKKGFDDSTKFTLAAMKTLGDTVAKK